MHGVFWLLFFAMAGFVVVVLAAGLVNGPITMKNACTRWPIWEWNQAPLAVTTPSE